MMPARFSPARLLPALLLPLLLVQGCVCSTSGVNRGDVNVVSLDEEWRMGQQLEGELAQQLALWDDPVVLEYLRDVGGRIIEQTELADRPWTFHLVQDDAVNAFVVPGGQVYVHAGLISAAETEAELAGVLAHEIGHGIARHATERMTKLYGLDFIARLLTSENPGLLQQIVTGIVGSGAVAKFSRDDEREADQLGVEYLYEAGYRPEAMASMFETLLEARKQRPNALERFFSTHPLTEERIENVRAAAAALPDDADLVSDTPAFRRVQARLAQPI